MSHCFDPITRSKLFLLSISDVNPTLLTHIDADNLPEEYGDKLQRKWRDMSNLEQPMQELAQELYEPSKQGEQIVKGPVSSKMAVSEY